eukprot:TRINITY_DN66079_c7_g6_i1.p1 TRINITY_DN66079_c7_g6~~TRINITY_DN66079_c7_g6_i1.p1  ORF type:complete len:1628 (+),score=368.58 TRINITY_DN66079_c7_g6_i1:23-4906(+)
MRAVLAVAVILFLGLVDAQSSYKVCRCGIIPPKYKYDIMSNYGPMCHTTNTGQELRSFVPTLPFKPDEDFGAGGWHVVNNSVESNDLEWKCDPNIPLAPPPTPPSPPPTKTKNETLIVNADNSFTFYYNGDQKLTDGGSRQWKKPQMTTFPIRTDQPIVFAVKGVDLGGAGGLLITGQGAVKFVSSSLAWKCTTNFYSGWNTVNYDDSKWPRATAYGKNSGSPAPRWGLIPQQNPNANWIWTSDPTLHNTVYCRYTNWCYGKSKGDNCGRQGQGNVCITNPTGLPPLVCGPPATCNRGKPSTQPWGSPNMQNVNAVVNVDNAFTVWYNGQQILTDNGNPAWKTSHTTTFQVDTNKPVVLAIEGTDLGGPGGIIASFSGALGINTNGLNWRCNKNQETGWNDIGFDDSCWPRAHAYGTNRRNPRPWGRISGQAGGAQWIWTNNHVKQHVAYCRVQVPRNMIGQQQNIIVNTDNTFTFYYNGVQKLTDNGDTRWKAPLMTSFPVDTTQPVVFAINGVDRGGPGALMITGKGPINFVTSPLAWKCSTTFQTGWNTVGFDDSQWSVAEPYGTNGQNPKPWGKIPQQSPNAQWIWTDDNNLHNNVYCRFTDWCYGKKAGDACGVKGNQVCVSNPAGAPALVCSHPTACGKPANPTKWTQNGNMMYIYNPNKMSYYRAKTWCGNQGGNLAAIHSAASNTFLKGLGSANAWFGAMKYSRTGKWAFSDGSTWDYGKTPGSTPWATNQPASNGPCASLNTNGMWYSYSCSTAMPFYCQKATGTNMKAVTATINVDNTFTAYYNGQQILSDGGNKAWKSPHTKTFNVDFNKEIVFAIKGVDAGGPGGMIASFTKSLFLTTKPYSWKCNTKLYTGWNDVNFDDSCWPRAHNYGLNRRSPRPWGKITAQQPSAYWIWTNDHRNHNTAYCRIVVPASAKMQMEQIRLNVDNSFNFYYNGVRKLTDNGNLAWKPTNQVTFPVDPTKPVVFAVQGIDKGGPGALMITGTGPIPFVTGPASWKCSTRYQKGWNQVGFDDSNWSHATSYGTNGPLSGVKTPLWGRMPLQNKYAQWIWTDDNKIHNNVYCRFVDWCYQKGAGQPCGAYKGAVCRKNPDSAFPAMVCGHPGTCTKGAPSTAAKGAPAFKTVSAKANVDNTYKFYYNGQIINAPTAGGWPKTQMFNFKVDMNKPIVFAFKGIDVGGPGGILASFTGPLTVLTSTAWKCNYKLIPGWNNIGFDDSCWPRAHNYGTNRYNPRPWGRRPNAAAGASWIWTNDHNKHNTVYCRIQVPQSMLQTYETVFVNVDNVFNFYYNGVRKLSDGGKIGWSRTYTTRFPVDPTKPVVMAIQGIDRGGPGGIIATGTGPYPFVTSDSAWKCSRYYQKGWNLPGFDDSNWSPAQSYGVNGVRPWKTIAKQSGKAQWIWTDDNNLNNVVYCRMSNVCYGKSQGTSCGKNKGQVCVPNKATGMPAMVCSHPITGCGSRPSPTASIGPQKMKPVKAVLNVDNTFKFYYNGKLIMSDGNNGAWRGIHAKYFNVDVNKPVVLAVYGRDLGGPGGILGTFTGALGTFYTNRAQWRCSYTYKANWNNLGFDDSCWSRANTYGRNGARPWGRIPSSAQSSNAYWIWTHDHNRHNTVYCRFLWKPTRVQ